MSLEQAFIQVIISLSPTFVAVCTLAIVFSWLRLVIDAMSGKGM